MRFDADIRGDITGCVLLTIKKVSKLLYKHFTAYLKKSYIDYE